MGATKEKKAEYFLRLKQYVQDFKSVFVVGIDNVSSQQMHEVRKALRGEAVVVMGKNTMIRRALRNFVNEFPDYEKLMPYIRGNVGFIFTNGDLKHIKEVVLANQVAAPARPGAIAPCDVYVPAGNTGMEPGKTSFFQALGVPTKIARGTIEITSDVKILDKDQKVGPSEAQLLNMLKISPFTFAMSVIEVYDDGDIFPSSLLDITDDELVADFTEAVSNITKISLASGYPTVSAVSTHIINAYQDIVNLSLGSDYTFEGTEELKDRLEHPEKYAAAAPAPSEEKKEDEEEEKKDEDEEEEEDSDEDMGMGLFD
ncbi:ribosomal protein P0 (A0) (L10E) [Brettanomyces bruxellensis]|uniref:60S acidic ribosomal protein P0 n=1 Tax=Dekkera bruxellensis TaxID=5007 RepID=A0A871R726_DEKBR|nr:ribosomal protein P0 (A0) (L10E) [Brettanomyces bruxellensis]QOU20534.1 ribosomal protein P0 (A0) (L10E) [Brettanomyces bruxellensis]